MELVIYGAVPSKKNSKQIFFNKSTGRSFITSSKAFKEWHEIASYEVMSWRNKLPTAERHPQPFRRAKVEIEIYSQTSRRNDLTNKAESIMDLLVDTKVIQDDDWETIPHIILKYGGLDRSNPRAIVTITKLPL